MKQVSAYRANKILYNFIISNNLQGRILLPANLCPDVVEILEYIGMDFQFIDIENSTLCMNQEQVMQSIGNAKILLFVHAYGVETDFSNFFLQVRTKNPSIVIIDDKCLCWPDLDGRYISPYCDLTLFSFCPKKQVDLGIGALGYVKGNWKYTDIHVGNGPLENVGYHLNKLELLGKMRVVCLHKKRLIRIYQKMLPQAIQFSDEFQHWRFNIWVENKEMVLQMLSKNGLFASGHYKPLVSQCYNANELYSHVINLFNDLYYTEEQAIETCKIMNVGISTDYYQEKC